MYCFGGESGIWAESSEKWDDAHPCWKAVGNSPKRVLKTDILVQEPDCSYSGEISDAFENSTNKCILGTAFDRRHSSLLDRNASGFNTISINTFSTETGYTNESVFNNLLYKSSIEHIFQQDRLFYLVSFTSGRTAIVRSKIPLCSNVYVIVEADRGEDCALVRDRISLDSHSLNNFFRTGPAGVGLQADTEGGEFPGNVTIKTVLRKASRQDIEFLEVRKIQEAKAFAKCNVLVQEKNLPIEVTGCEFQWDMKKITFYFRSDRRVDFRDLVKELFRFYRIRIWMSMENRRLIQ